MNKKYFTGGFAEIVHSPSTLTSSFFSFWFTGEQSIGKAMQLLGLPYSPIAMPILKQVHGELVVDLEAQEKTFYQPTVFSYAERNSAHDVPRLRINREKLLSPKQVVNTIQLLRRQSQWTSLPEEPVLMAETFLKDIPAKIADTVSENDIILADLVWPNVLAIGTICDFLFETLLKKTGKDAPLLQQYILQKVTQKNWFMQAIQDKYKVKQKKITFEEFIKKYKYHSDNNFELTTPRWHEVASDIKKCIAALPMEKLRYPHTTYEPEKNIKELTQAVISIEILYSRSKQKALVHIDALRKAILNETRDISKSIGNLTRDAILSGSFVTAEQKKGPPLKVINGSGMSVSTGKVTGKARHILQTTRDVPPDSVCIFPNSSPYFTLQYARCKGIIFLKGGQTSHGAIVAREFGIPAIVDQSAALLRNGTLVTLDGEKGKWTTGNE